MMFNVDDLVERKLVVAKDVGNDYTMYKYHRKVFYDNLWHLDERLLECRGIIVDRDGMIVQRPFKKVFNYGENNTLVPRDKEVIAVRKVNGFLGVLTGQDGERIASTTGSTTSKFADMVRNHTYYVDVPEHLTYMFEICDESDPHVVPEEYGTYLIGIRNKETGQLFKEEDLDVVARAWHLKRPEWKVCRFSDILKEVKSVKHEGFMIIDPDTNEPLCKLKSPYYLSKKFLQRMSDTKVEQMFANPDKFKHIVEEEFFKVIDYVTNSYKMEEWKALTEIEKSEIISACYFMEV